MRNKNDNSKNRNQNRNIRKNIFSFKKVIISIIAIFAIMFTLAGTCNIVTAAGSSFQLPKLNKYEVYKGGDDSTPDYNSYPFNSTGIISVGFDSLYGVNKSLLTYLGEIPSNLEEEDNFSQYRTFDGDEIDGQTRKWASTSKDDLAKESNSKAIKDDKLNSNTREPHIWAMTVSHSFFGGGIFGVLFWFVYAINWLATKIVVLMITLKSLDLASLASTLDSGGSFSKQLSTIFLINPDTGSVSPVLLFGIIAFIVSFISLGFKVAKGGGGGNSNKSFRSLINEFGFFLLAIVIAAIFLTPSNTNKLSKIGTDFMTTITNDAINTSNATTNIFTYKSEGSDANTKLDNALTQEALINKTYIDQMIKAQFGYGITDLQITESDGKTYSGNFGKEENVKEAMKATFGGNATINTMAISVGNEANKGTSTSKPGEHWVNNLGYYFWAANSGVGTCDGSKKSTAVISTSGKKTVTTTGSSDRVLYVVDFLSNLRQKASEDNDNATVAKIDKIMNNLTKPSYATATWNLLYVAIQNGMLAYGLLSIAIFTILGQLILSLGSYCMMIMPTLLLFSGTRRVAKQMSWSYILGFLRYLVGSALFNAVILASTLLSQQGFIGIVASCFACFVLAKFAPDLIRQINMQLEKVGRGKEFAPMSNIYRKMDNSFDKYGYKRRSAMNRNAAVVDENGNIVTAESRSISQGIKDDLKNGKIPGKDGAFNPFSKKSREKWRQDQIDQYNGDIRVDNESLNSNVKLDGVDVPNFDAHGNPLTSKAKNDIKAAMKAGGGFVGGVLVDAAGHAVLDKYGKTISSLEALKNFSGADFDKLNLDFKRDENGEIILDENGLPTLPNDNIDVFNTGLSDMTVDEINNGVENENIDLDSLNYDSLKNETDVEKQFNSGLSAAGAVDDLNLDNDPKYDYNDQNTENGEEGFNATNIASSNMNKNIDAGVSNIDNNDDNNFINGNLFGKNSDNYNVVNGIDNKYDARRTTINPSQETNININRDQDSQNDQNIHNDKNTHNNEQIIGQDIGSNTGRRNLNINRTVNNNNSNNVINNDDDNDDNNHGYDREMYKEVKTKKRNVKLANAGLRAVNALPIFGPELNKIAAKKVATSMGNYADKGDILSKVQGEIIKSNNTLTKEQAFNKVMNDEINNSRAKDRDNIVKKYSSIKSNLTRKDVDKIDQNVRGGIVEKVNTERQKVERKATMLQNEEVIKAAQEIRQHQEQIRKENAAKGSSGTRKVVVNRKRRSHNDD